jgi:hypothetical protein
MHIQIFCFAVGLVLFGAAFGLLLLQLERIITALESGALRGPQGHQGERGERGEDAVLPPHLLLAAPPPAAARGMARVLRLKNGEWVTGEWVRENSIAWQTAYDTPGMALQPESGDTIHGVQATPESSE